MDNSIHHPASERGYSQNVHSKCQTRKSTKAQVDKHSDVINPRRQTANEARAGMVIRLDLI